MTLRRNLHVAVGFLAATVGPGGPARLCLRTLETPLGPISTAQAGAGPPLLALHGLGGSKQSFLPTLTGLADSHRVIAVDLPGFGDSVKPAPAAYDAAFFARAVTDVLDVLGLERTHLAGNSMGGRIALQVAFDAPERVDRLVLLSPAMAWLRPRHWAPVVRFLRPELRLVGLAPRNVVDTLARRLVPDSEDGWSAAGVDEFLRSYATPQGRYAFHASARNIYLDEPHGDAGLWTRLTELRHLALFVWGRHDKLVPIGFMRHVERALPAARHLELECGHVPQIERPEETNGAMREFLAASSSRRRGEAARGRVPPPA